MTGVGGVTVTPIYWEPSAGRYTFPSGYQKIIDGYIGDLAAASGGTNNVTSVDAEYYQEVNGVKTPIAYNIKAGTRLVDTDAFPSDGCTPDSGYGACLTDAQLRTELGQITKSDSLPTDLSHFYPVFLPPMVESMDLDGTTSASAFCGYHRAFGTGGDQTIYGDLPYPPSNGGCDTGQAPNGNPAADGMVSTFSHELNEAITDPLTPQNAWLDEAGHEIGDMCSDTYGRPLGSTDPTNPDSTEYNQVINGSRYYTQTEFSNSAFATFGIGKGCAQSQALAQNPNGVAHAQQTRKVVVAFVDATPIAVPADGSTKSTIMVTTSDATSNGVAGDHVHLNIGLQSGTGVCGKLNSTDGTTDASGNLTVTYTPSADNVSCWVYAIEANGGNSGQAVIYQGTTQKDAATLDATFPTSLKAGGSQATFTIKAGNPSPMLVPSARLDFAIFAGTGTTKSVDDSQVHLSYSTTGPNGPFTDVGLTGSTANGNVIDAYLGTQRGVTLPAESTETWTFHVTLASSVPASNTPLMAFEAYLDQINTASGSGDTLADSYATDVMVSAPSGSNTGWYVLIGVGAFVVVLAIAGVPLWRRRQSHPHTPSSTPTPS